MWDNRREDRFRHIDMRREVAAEYVGVMARLAAAVQALDWYRKALKEHPDRDHYKKNLQARKKEAEELRAKGVLLEGQLDLLFSAS